MEPSIPTSFIPKRPVTTEMSSVSSSRHSVGLLSALTVVVVIATLVSFAGVYLYEQRLKGQKTTLEQSITEARDGLGSEFVADMQRLSARISGVQELIGGHVVISPIFQALQETTLQSVQYKQFTYAIKTDAQTKTTVVEVNLTGTAKSYSTIALQSDAYAKSALIKNPVFSNLTVNDKDSRVDFKLVFTVGVTDLSYQKFIETINKQTVTQSPVVIPQQ